MNHQRQIKAFFFDIGGVLVRVDSKRSIEQLSSRLKISEERVQNAMTRELLNKYEKGQMNSNQFYENLLINCKSTQQIELQEFKDYYLDMLFPIQESLELLKRVTQDFPTYLLSNTNDFHYDLLMDQFPFMAWVNGGTYSFMEGSMKPEALIYERAIKKSGFPPEEILFIDDLEANVQGARQVGLKALLFVDYEGFKVELKSQFPELGYLL